MFKQRLISGIILVIIAAISIGLGGAVMFGVVEGITLIGLFEFYRVFKIEKKSLGILGYITAIGYYIMLYSDMQQYILPYALLFLILCMALYVYQYPNYKAQEVLAAIFSFFYIVVLLSCLYQVRMMENGVILVVLVFLSAWGCDTCAYCVGMLIGKHKMAPVLSPKKTIEGGIGGIVGAGLLGAILAVVTNQVTKVPYNPVIVYPIICMVGGAISQIGDLAASAIKRNFEVKDYGTLIPGHGGILDRFDSIIFTAPIIYFGMLLLQNYWL